MACRLRLTLHGLAVTVLRARGEKGLLSQSSLEDRVRNHSFSSDDRLARLGDLGCTLLRNPRVSESVRRVRGVSTTLGSPESYTISQSMKFRALEWLERILKALGGLTANVSLGSAAFGVGGREILSAIQIAMIAGMSCTRRRDAVLTHPTFIGALSRSVRPPSSTARTARATA